MRIGPTLARCANWPDVVQPVHVLVMVNEFNNPPYLAWLPDAALHYLGALGLLLLLGLIVGFLIAAVRYGPMAAGDMMYRLAASAGTDLVRFSPRRVFALARLAVQEAVRRRVWVALVMFGLILLFAGWFLGPPSGSVSQAGDQAKQAASSIGETGTTNFDPGKLNTNFVLTATSFLVMLLALFLSALSIPADMKSHTIYTIVTKPVRTGEIVLGRILGFTFVGTVLLAIMGGASYLFVGRTLDHTHELTAADLRDLPVEPGAAGGKEGQTSINQNHTHHVVLDADGNGVTDVQQGHFHRVHAEKGADGKIRYIVGPPEEQLVARVPIYAGKDSDPGFKFLDRAGKPGEGINVGKEWTYRKYLDGGTPMSAIWTFYDIKKDRFPDGRLPFEMTLRVFRTFKGEIADEKKKNRTVGILGSVVLRNPQQPGVKTVGMIFEVKDQQIDSHTMPAVMQREVDGEYKAVKLFKDPGDTEPALVSDDGRLEVMLQCLSPSQYIGVARDDIYLKTSNGSYSWNFCKGFFGIWMQMVLIVGFGVMFSTFLSGPVAMLGTLATMVLGFFSDDISKLFTAVITNNPKLVPGGGPIESLIRVIEQYTITLPLEDTRAIEVVKFFDVIVMAFMKAVVEVIPKFGDFSNVQFVADGFNVPATRILEQATTGFGFLLALFLVGHLFLRMREIAKS